MTLDEKVICYNIGDRKRRLYLVEYKPLVNNSNVEGKTPTENIYLCWLALIQFVAINESLLMLSGT